jgi:hypothetical protein
MALLFEGPEAKLSLRWNRWVHVLTGTRKQPAFQQKCNRENKPQHSSPLVVTKTTLGS